MTKSQFELLIRQAYRTFPLIKVEASKHIAIAYRKNRIVAIGYNSPKTHPRAPTPYMTQHAEFNVITRLQKLEEDLSHLDLLIVRLNRKLELRSSRPCKACEKMLSTSGFRHIYYSVESGHQLL